MGSGILLDVRDGVARITLNRPAVGNAIDIPAARALMEAAIVCDEDAAVRCVLLTGTGRYYCTGGDIAAFGDAGEQLPAFLREITAYLHAAIVRLMRMAKPVVVAVNGPVAGAGVGIALLGDVVLAAPSAHFTLAYTGIGMSPDAGSTWLLPRLVGLRRAQELCLLNRRVGAAEAAAIGMITRVAGDALLEAEASSIAAEFARGATAALGATRQLLLDGLGQSLERQLEEESQSIAEQGRSADGREGISAFLAKRPPLFLGRSQKFMADRP